MTTTTKQRLISYEDIEQKKTAILIGFEVSGFAKILLWSGDEHEIEMDKTEFPKSKYSMKMIERCVNDGGFGCRKILSAKVFIRSMYKLENNKTLGVFCSDRIIHRPAKILLQIIDFEF